MSNWNFTQGGAELAPDADHLTSLYHQLHALVNADVGIGHLETHIDTSQTDLLLDQINQERKRDGLPSLENIEAFRQNYETMFGE